MGCGACDLKGFGRPGKPPRNLRVLVNSAKVLTEAAGGVSGKLSNKHKIAWVGLSLSRLPVQMCCRLTRVSLAFAGVVDAEGGSPASPPARQSSCASVLLRVSRRRLSGTSTLQPSCAPAPCPPARQPVATQTKTKSSSVRSLADTPSTRIVLPATLIWAPPAVSVMFIAVTKPCKPLPPLSILGSPVSVLTIRT